MGRGLIPTMTTLPYTIRKFYEEEAKKNGESLSTYLRHLLILLYETKQTLRNMEKSESELSNGEKYGEKDE